MEIETFFCNSCNRKLSSQVFYDKHVSSKKHNTKLIRINKINWICEFCNVGFKYRSEYYKHTSTNEHVEKRNAGLIQSNTLTSPQS